MVGRARRRQLPRPSELVVAFPFAHGIILGELYLPVALMLIGLTLRGVAFDFRVKAKAEHKSAWTLAFFAGSLTAAVAQGYMLGRVVTGFADNTWSFLFAGLIGLGMASGYTLLGATWLVIKTSDELQRQSIVRAKRSIVLLAIGIAAVFVATPFVSERIFEKWFGLQNLIVLWPNLVIDRVTIWEAAAAPESLLVIFIGAVIVLPVIVGYSVYAYRVFGGKVTNLTYY